MIAEALGGALRGLMLLALLGAVVLIFGVPSLLGWLVWNWVFG